MVDVHKLLNEATERVRINYVPLYGEDEVFLIDTIVGIVTDGLLARIFTEQKIPYFDK